MQFQVPQFIETEDKILGPLSLRQFIYLSLSIGASLLLYAIFNFWIWLLFSAVLVGGTAAVLLVKVNGRSFGVIALRAIEFYWQPQTYVWMPDQPNMPKTQETVKQASGFSMESIISGLALNNAWHRVQVGTTASAQKVDREEKRTRERYGVVSRITGDRQIAKRIDYR